MSNPPVTEPGPLTSPAGPSDASRLPADSQISPHARAWSLGAALTGMEIALGAMIGLWFGDVVLLAASGGSGASARQCVVGMGAAFLVGVTTAIVVGALLGAVLQVPAARFVSAVRSWWHTNATGEQAGRSLAAFALTLGILLTVWGEVTYGAVLWLLFDIARPDTVVFALTLSHVLFAITAVLAWVPVLGTVRGLVDRAWEVGWLRAVLSRRWPVPAALGLGLAIVGGAVAYHYRIELAALPWLSGAPLLAAAAGVLLAALLRSAAEPRRTRWRRAALAVIAIGLTAGTVAGAAIRPESTKTQIVAFDRAMSGRVGYGAWRFVLDFDRDGQIGILGGGDCAPFDASRHTGAVDIPNNGIDEDCDGADLSTVALRPRGREGVRPGLPNRPSVILVTIDALGAPRLQTFGSPTPLMPNVDRLAKESMAFSHCFSQGPSTRLSFPSMFTSRYDSQLVFNYAPRIPYSIGDKERQIQDEFDDAGYETVAVIPNSYFDRARWPSVTRGFQRVDMSALSSGKHNAAQVTDAALRVLSETSERPLYLWIHYFDAHPPYQPLPGVEYTDRSDKSYYEAELMHIDHELGRLFDAIEKRSDPTYLIFTSDHSTVFHPIPQSRHFHYGYDLYTATLHVPLLVHGPGIRPGRVDDLVTTMDIVPTLTELLRMPDRAPVEGTSLLPELTRGTRDPGRILFHEFFLPEFVYRGKDPLDIVSARDEHYNLILNRSRGNYEMYDWRSDYYEIHDLYEDMARSPEAARLRSMLSAFVHQFYRDGARTSAEHQIEP